MLLPNDILAGPPGARPLPASTLCTGDPLTSPLPLSGDQDSPQTPFFGERRPSTADRPRPPARGQGLWKELLLHFSASACGGLGVPEGPKESVRMPGFDGGGHFNFRISPHLLKIGVIEARGAANSIYALAKLSWSDKTVIKSLVRVHQGIGLWLGDGGGRPKLQGSYQGP